MFLESYYLVPGNDYGKSFSWSRVVAYFSIQNSQILKKPLQGVPASCGSMGEIKTA